MQLKGKKIIVTGGTKGIGAATVRIYVREGAQVVFCGTNDERGNAVAEQANAQPGVEGHATYMRCDISDKAAVDEFFAKAKEILGGLDVLANVAGVESNAAAEAYTLEQMQFLMNINMYGTVYTNQAAYKIFKETGVEGSIINYASDVALMGMPNGAMYAASKGAVLSWTRSIAMEWGIESNVRANCVNPTIKTAMYEEWLRTVDPAVREMHLAGLKRRYPIDGAMGDADRDCAPIMVFLASEGSRYINGQVFCVNGGATMVR
ncbi:MAG: SDR family oxidoreductase [Lachnospiraceae bacterium]|nr:SDR family oxidoreductase [Lachnospiraceae bacterium]